MAFTKSVLQAGIIIATALLAAQSALGQTSQAVQWRDALRQSPGWYAGPEALRIADNLLVYQRDSGGWAKNIDMAQPLDERVKAELLKHHQDIDSTIDNGATFTQLCFLAKTYSAQRLDRHRHAFLKGLDYLLKAQYDNGGWPQFYPDLRDYYRHITYNDDAMIGVMKLLRDVAAGKPEFGFVDQERRQRSSLAVQKGIACILKTQVLVGGKRTVWCAQHDEVTFAPARARAYELVSLSGGESVGIVRFLMSIDKPSPLIVESIKGAMEWFEKSKLTGIKWVAKPDKSKLRGFDRVVVSDPAAGPLWARFYEIGSNRPIFVGRDGIVRYDVAEIEDERRNGYAWYVDSPASLLETEYPEWLKNIE